MDLGSLPSSDDEIGVVFPGTKKEESKQILATCEIDIDDSESSKSNVYNYGMPRGGNAISSHPLLNNNVGSQKMS